MSQIRHSSAPLLSRGNKPFLCEFIPTFVGWEIWPALDSIRGFLCTGSSPIFLWETRLPQFSSEIFNCPEMFPHATPPPPSCEKGEEWQIWERFDFLKFDTAIIQMLLDKRKSALCKVALFIAMGPRNGLSGKLADILIAQTSLWLGSNGELWSRS